MNLLKLPSIPHLDSMSDSSASSQILAWILFGGKAVGGLILTLTFILYCNQEKLLYIPNPPGFPKTPIENPPGFNSPKDWSTGGRSVSRADSSAESIPFEEAYVTTSDGKQIHTWLLLQSDHINTPTLIYFHGNAGNMGFRLKNAAMMYARSKLNVLMMDYRGYGSSEGTPTEQGLNLDGEVVLNYAVAHPKLRNSPIILFGRSLGGAVAISLAHKFPQLVAGVVVENTFTSVSGMVDVLMPVLTPLKQWLLFMKWNSDEKIQQLTQPIFFISGDSDELVPPSHMKTLYNLALKSAHREFYSVFAGSHNNTWEVGGSMYYTRLQEFVRDHVAKSADTASTAASNANSKSSSSSSGSGPAADSKNGADEDDDDEYCVVNKEGALPTMGTNFSVK